MGNYLQRENRWWRDTQEVPWKPKLRNAKQKTSRCWDHCHVTEECFCLPWKKICIFKTRQDPQKKNEGMTSTPIQDHAKQTYAEELCYVLINHRAPWRRTSEASAEVYYENVSCKAERPRESLGGTETEYSLLHVPSPLRHPPSPESEYELLMPSRISSHSLQQPHALTTPFETQFSHLP